MSEIQNYNMNLNRNCFNLQNSFIPTISIPIPGGGTYDRIADETSGEIDQINSKLITIFKFYR